MSTSPSIAPPGLSTTGGTINGNLAVTGTITAGPNSGALPVLQATTGEAGFPKVNGTPTILTWTAPNDGNEHRATVICSEVVSSAETGGQVSITSTPPGGAPVTTAVFASGAGAGSNFGNTVVARFELPVAPNTAVTIAQSAALTVGASVVNAEIWGS